MLKTETRLFNPMDGSVLSFSESEAQIGAAWARSTTMSRMASWASSSTGHTEDVLSGAADDGPGEVRLHLHRVGAGRLEADHGEVTGAIEWMELKSEDGAFRSKERGPAPGRWGGRARSRCARAATTEPVTWRGYSRDEWVVNYAFTSDWNDDAVGAAFGGHRRINWRSAATGSREVAGPKR